MSSSTPKRPLSVKVRADAGLEQLVTIGTCSMITGFLIFVLAIPTICMLPYEKYMPSHLCNMAMPLYFLIMGHVFRGAVLSLGQPDYTCLGGRIFRPPLSLAARFAVTSLFVILYSWGAFAPSGANGGSTSMNGMVLHQTRNNNWGDLHPTENQIWTLYILYILISFLYGIGAVLAFVGAVIAIIYWIVLASQPRLEKEEHGNEEADGMSTKLDMENEEYDKSNKDGVALKVVTISNGQPGQYV